MSFPQAIAIFIIACMIDVVYPYVDSMAVWQELRYSLRSLEQNFKEEFRVNIIGDLPGWVQNVRHIPHKRTPGLYRSVCYDACTKMVTVAKDPSISADFIYMNDDIYFLNPINLDLFNQNYAMENLERGTVKRDTKHQGLVWDTYNILKTKGFDKKAVFNTANHAPQLLNRYNFIQLCYKFAPRKNRLLPTILYGNVYPKPGDWQLIRKGSKYRAGFYGFNGWDSFGNGLSKPEINKIFQDFYLLNHDDNGLSSVLKECIEEKFSTKSKFEK